MARLQQLAGCGTLAAWCLVVWSGAAAASPWTLPDGTTVLSLSTDVQYADREFLPDGTHQVFPVDGQFFSTNLRVGLRHGISDTLEVGAEASIGLLQYEADEVYFAPDTAAGVPIGDVRANILSFDSQQLGPGDLYLHARQRLFTAARSVLTAELNVKVPTGYEAPGEAVGDNLPSRIIDDVTVGDGQMDVTALLLLGLVPTGSWFARIDAGFRARFFGPGHQIVGALKFGGRVVEGWVPFIAADAVHSVTEGDVVALSYVTDFPEVPAEAFGADLVRPIDLRLDRTVIRAGVGSIVTVGNMDLNLSYTYVVWGQNTAQLHIVAFGTAFTL